MNDLLAESLANQPWLSLLTFLPLVGAFGIALRQMMAKRGAAGEISAAEQAQIDSVSRRVAMLFTLGAFVVSVFIYVLITTLHSAAISSSSMSNGSAAAFPTKWASTAYRSFSSC